MAPSRLKAKSRTTVSGTYSSPVRPNNRIHTRLRRKSRPDQPKVQAICVCGGVDDGRAMVSCGVCNKWYHFGCVGLRNSDAEDIAVYVCKECAETAGHGTIMKWDCSNSPNATDPYLSSLDTDVENISRDEVDESDLMDVDERSYYSDSGGDATSSDGYISDNRTSANGYTAALISGLSQKKRRRAVTQDSSQPISRTRSLDVQDDDIAVPSSGVGLLASERAESGKRDSGVPADDPVRKYCYGKLLEVILPIFNEYHLSARETTLDMSRTGLQKDDLNNISTEVETGSGSTSEEAETFVEELEWYLFTNYSELDDKKGKRVAAAKYRERFRTLTFNLAQKDRLSLRKRIATHDLSAQELSRMSSTDLANEHRQQEIENARRESLQHSILQVRAAPTAKITHKGEEVIETVNDDFSPRKQAEDTHEELMTDNVAHLPALDMSGGRTLQMRDTESMLDQAAGLQAAAVAGTNGAVVDRNVTNTSNGLPVASDGLLPDAPADHGLGESSASRTREGLQVSSSSQIITPLAEARIDPPVPLEVLPPVVPLTPSFDLNSLWSGGGGGDGHIDHLVHPPAEISSEAQSLNFDPGLDESLHVSLDDKDFGEFLTVDLDVEESPPPLSEETNVPPEQAAQAIFKALPVVWNGELVMPMDPAAPIICAVSARQVGGPELELNPSVWGSLFTSQLLRIDGRVAVQSSTQYLISMRMTSTKELVVAALAPGEGSERAKFDSLFEFLYSRSRHALVFPWGPKPPDSAPGKDLYLVPLKPADPVPEYVQLLDHVRLPTIRADNVLLGVFVLHKGRVPRSELLRPLVLPLIPTSALAPMLPQGGSSFSPPLQPAQPMQIDTSALATLSNDLANLTPEQLQLVQSLLGSAALPAGLGGGFGPTSSVVLPPTSSVPILPQVMSQTSAPPYSSHSRGARSPLPRGGVPQYMSPQPGATMSVRDNPGIRSPDPHGPPRYDMGRGRNYVASNDNPRGRSFEGRLPDSGWGGRGRGRGGVR